MIWSSDATLLQIRLKSFRIFPFVILTVQNRIFFRFCSCKLFYFIEMSFSVDMYVSVMTLYSIIISSFCLISWHIWRRQKASCAYLQISFHGKTVEISPLSSRLLIQSCHTVIYFDSLSKFRKEMNFIKLASAMCSWLA